jgi:hypothetical protein
MKIGDPRADLLPGCTIHPWARRAIADPGIPPCPEVLTEDLAHLVIRHCHLPPDREGTKLSGFDLLGR